MEPPIATSTAGGFERARAAALAAGLGFEHVRVTGSTNEDLAAAARAGCRKQAVLVADHQTSGRGRLDRRWVDEPGRDLLVSVRLGVRFRPAATVAAVAAALRQAVAALLDEPVGFKWPNDLVVESGSRPGKLAGILSEFVQGDPPVVIVGCGVNVGSTGTVAGATSVLAPSSDARSDVRLAPSSDARSDARNGPRSRSGIGARDAILAATIEGLAERLEEPCAAVCELRSHSATLGHSVSAELPDGRVVHGVAVDIDAEGRLLISGPGGITSVGVGDVARLRLGGPTPISGQ